MSGQLKKWSVKSVEGLTDEKNQLIENFKLATNKKNHPIKYQSNQPMKKLG